MTFYLINQLRGWAGPMQMPEVVPGVMEKQGKTAYALLHNLGLGKLLRLMLCQFIYILT